MQHTLKETTWWGSFTMEPGEAGCWKVGPTVLWIYRLEREWRLVHTQYPDPLHDILDVQLPLPPDEVDLSLEAVPEDATLSRFSFDRTEAAIVLTPMLADRAVIVRPETPLFVTEGEAVTLYVSTPVWIRFEAGEPVRWLHEAPTFRPSDTWFGPSTREGELCYATRTLGRIRLEDLPRRLYRAVTPVQLSNQAGDPWRIERLHLPVPNLALYHAGDEGLWTPSVTVVREKGGHLAELHIGEGPPPEVPGAAFLNAPRHASRANVIVRTISTLFSKIREA